MLFKLEIKILSIKASACLTLGFLKTQSIDFCRKSLPWKLSMIIRDWTGNELQQFHYSLTYVQNCV